VQEVELERVAEIIAEQARDFLGVIAVVWVADHTHQEYRLLAVSSPFTLRSKTLDDIECISFDSSTITAQAGRTEQPVELRDVLAAGPANRLGRRIILAEDYRAAFAQPLVARERLVGVLTLAYPSPHAFVPEERELIRALGDLGAVAIDNAQVYRDARDATRRAAESAALLDTLQEMAPIGFGFIDPDLRYVRVNRALAKLNGRPAGEHLGHTVGEIIPHMAPHLEPMLRRVLATGKSIDNFEVTPRQDPTLPEGSVWLLNYYPVPAPDGTILGVGCVVVDITELKRAERAVLASQEHYHRLVDNLPVVVFRHEFEPKPHLSYVSPAVTKVFGYTPDEVYSDPELTIERARDEDRAALRDVLQGKSLPTAATRQICRKDGKPIWIEVERVPLENSAGQRIGFEGIVKDVTAQKELEREREEWLSLIAHDLRQPITIVLGYAMMLAKELAAHGNAAEIKAVNYIVTATQNLSQMIGDLLDVSRIETRRLAIQPELIDVAALIKGVAERFAPSLGGHQLRIKAGGVIPPIEADPSRIEQVLGNLLTNAVKYGYESSEIRVEYACRDDLVEIAVINEGEGVAPDELPHLFSRFHRSRRAREQNIPGLGLGLYIAKGLVETHGGRIWVESVAHQTTAFRFTLPLHHG
jgi:PAS domain S-box-containing protein